MVQYSSTHHNRLTIASWLGVSITLILTLYSFIGDNWSWSPFASSSSSPSSTSSGSSSVKGNHGHGHYSNVAGEAATLLVENAWSNEGGGSRIALSDEEMTSLGFNVALLDGGNGKDEVTDWEGMLHLWEDKGNLSPATLQSPPVKPPFTASILYLLSTHRINQAGGSLEVLARNVPLSQPYPILFLHEGDFDDLSLRLAFYQRWEERIKAVRESEEKGGREIADKMETLGRLIEWVEVDLTAPAEIMKEGKEKLKPEADYAWPGYHAMCRFFATGVFNHPRLRNMDYYMRMDTDSFIFSPLPTDPFVQMHHGGYYYGYRNMGTDIDRVTVGMWDLVEEWQSNHESAKELAGVNEFYKERYAEGIRFPMFNNNWEIVNIPRFRQPDIQAWLLEVRSHTIGFFKYRWGDAPLRFATTSMFMRPEDVLEFCNFDYWHQSTVAKTCTLPVVPSLGSAGGEDGF